MRALARWLLGWAEGWRLIGVAHEMRLRKPHSYLCAKRVWELAGRTIPAERIASALVQLGVTL